MHGDKIGNRHVWSSHGGHGWRRPIVLMLAVLLAALGVPALSAPEAAAAANSLTISKRVDKAAPLPGESFTYTVRVSCSEDDCLDAQIQDQFSPLLEGFPIQNVSLTPSSTTIPRTVAWLPGGTTTPPAKIGTDTKLVIDLEQVLDSPVGTGIKSGQTFTAQITLKVPDDFPPGAVTIPNTASVSASNADTKTDNVDVVIDPPVELALTVTKDWRQNNQSYEPGAPSTIGLTARNTSNVNVDTLTLQEPKTAPDAAPALDASNPFTITDFTGFSNASLPAGCTNVRVDAYVKTGGTWAWQQGGSTSTPAPLVLPAGVTNAQVGGIRIVCAGDMPPGQVLSADVGLAQRSTQRDTDADLSRTPHTVNNVATGSVALDDDTMSADGRATYTVAPLIPSVAAAKNITDERITAGQSAPATISGIVGANRVARLHLADLDFFTDKVTFGGFTAPLTWPAGATSPATITYHLLGGGTQQVPALPGATPPAPSGKISGFEITWTGQIAGDETGGASFAIDTTEDAAGAAGQMTLRNTVAADVTAVNGLT
ncbi:MAG: hypothetical protein L0H31_05555, partial [Nocardioidaceae bacterium]|nr:hypothetical protein [Nocardioidaceae bacterium]